MEIFIFITFTVFVLGTWWFAQRMLRIDFQKLAKKLQTSRQLAYKAVYYNEDHENWAKYRWRADV